MTQRGFVYFRDKRCINEVISATNLRSMNTVLDIKKYLCEGRADLNRFRLGIRYKTYQDELSDDEELFKKYPMIICNNNNINCRRSDYALFKMDNMFCRKAFIFVVSANVDTIPRFTSPVTDEQLKRLTIREYLSFASDYLDIQNKPLKFHTEDYDIDMNKRLSSMYKLAKSGKDIYFNCELSEAGKDMIRYREHIISTMTKDEVSYVNQLSTLNDFWKPKIFKLRLVDSRDHRLIFGNIPDLLSFHKEFLRELRDSSRGYATELAGLFIKSVSKFKDLYGAHLCYEKIKFLLQDKLRNPEFKKQIKALSAEVSDREIICLIDSVIYKICNYLKNIKLLKDNTPKSHPDSEMLEEAQSVLEAYSNTLESDTKVGFFNWRLGGVEKRLLNSFKIIVPNRVHLFETNVQIFSRSKKSGIIYIFSDIILLVKSSEKGYSALFDSPIGIFHYIPRKNNSIKISSVCKEYNSSFLNRRKEYTVSFPNAELYNKFFEIIENSLGEIMKTETAYLKWSLFDDRSSPPAKYPALTADRNNLILFGSKNEKEGVKFHIFPLKKGEECRTYGNNTIRCRAGHTCNIIGSRLFIIGGSNGEKFHKNVLCYDFSTDIWSEPLFPDNQFIEPRYGHTTVDFEKRLYIYGGKNVDGKMISNIVCFNYTSNMCETIEVSGPLGRYHHACAVSGEHMYISGGKHKGRILSDFWAFNFSTRKWSEIKIDGPQIGPMTGHSLVALHNMKNILLLVSGSTNCFLIDTNVKKAVIVSQIGNIPYSLVKFGLAISHNTSMFVYGGYENKCNTPSHNIYKLEFGGNDLKSLGLPGLNILPKSDEVNRVSMRHGLVQRVGESRRRGSSRDESYTDRDSTSKSTTPGGEYYYTSYEEEEEFSIPDTQGQHHKNSPAK